MNFTNIKNLKYSKADCSCIDILATCEEYGEIPMTLNLVDIEDLHHFATGAFKTIIVDDVEVQEEILIPLEQYCKTLNIAPYVAPIIPKEDEINNFKSLRDSALKDVDFYQLALVYAELTAKQKKELKVYRLALLDSTKTQILPTKPDWFK